MMGPHQAPKEKSILKGHSFGGPFCSNMTFEGFGQPSHFGVMLIHVVSDDVAVAHAFCSSFWSSGK